MVEITITHSHESKINGFKYFWLKHIRGFNSHVHCGRCLLGTYSKQIGLHTQLNCSITLHPAKEYDYIYLCGVSPKWSTNLHIAMQPDNQGRILRTTYNGYTIAIYGATELPIPELTPGYDGRDATYTTCRNYQFGVAVYGLPQHTPPKSLDDD